MLFLIAVIAGMMITWDIFSRKFNIDKTKDGDKYK